MQGPDSRIAGSGAGAQTHLHGRERWSCRLFLGPLALHLSKRFSARPQPPPTVRGELLVYGMPGRKAAQVCAALACVVAAVDAFAPAALNAMPRYRDRTLPRCRVLRKSSELCPSAWLRAIPNVALTGRTGPLCVLDSGRAMLQPARKDLRRVSVQRPAACLALRMALPPGWQSATDEASGREFYYNSETGVTQWEPPAPPPPPVEKSAREIQMEKVLERQRIQDADKMKRGALALESNRTAVILATTFIVLPLIFLAVGYFAGVIPNPFSVCIEGGTNC